MFLPAMGRAVGRHPEDEGCGSTPPRTISTSQRSSGLHAVRCARQGVPKLDFAAITHADGTSRCSTHPST